MIRTYPHLRGVVMENQDTKPELPVHMILGANLYTKIKMKEVPRVGNSGEPVVERTKFGWTLTSAGAEVNDHIYLTHSTCSDYDRLCRLDVLGIEDKPDGDQYMVYEEFKEQLRRDPEGWYETGLLWKLGHKQLNDNKEASIGRFNNLTSKLKRDPKLLEDYDQKIQDQLAEGIVEIAPEEPDGVQFYLPHKPIVKETCESTKLRIVYDASAKQDPNSASLNDCLEPGPPLQKRLWNILLRSRLRPIVITGDIRQEFLQIRIRKEFRDLLRFHWIKDKSSLDYHVLRFTRAVFGVNQSPFLLGGTIDTHLDNYSEDLPEIVEEIKENLYVDDIISGGDNDHEVGELKKLLIEIFKAAGFHLHKWNSNIKHLEQSCSEDDVEADQTYAKQQMNVKKNDAAILGVAWNKEEDSIKVKFPEKSTGNTKRGVLQYLAAVYDPLGLVSPILLKAKMLYREICDQKVGWDRQLEGDLKTCWTTWKRHLPKVIRVPRPISPIQAKIERVVLHAFADASKDGVSAVLYAVVQQGGEINQGLLASKSRLSKKNLTIPRLELVAAHMAANILENSSHALKMFPLAKSVAWSDSTVVLYWIKGNCQYKQFVSNRVNKIKSQPEMVWRHVSTKENPADIGSRGCSGDQLGEQWLQGPAWLKDEEQWPTDITAAPSKESEIEATQIRETVATTVEVDDSKVNTLIYKYSFWKTMRVTGWIRRFIRNCKAKHKDQKKTGPLTTQETEQSKLCWIKKVQSEFEKDEKFQEDKERLNLQKDHRGVYVCVGRIEGEFPIYLPSKSILTEKLVQDAHIRTLHGGAGFSITELRRTYWIPRLRKIVKGVIHRCYGCKRFTAQMLPRPSPGNLPPDRTIGSRPFQVIGLDFAGPFLCTKGRRTKSPCKTYILLYACSLTRAVYLDLLLDQSFEEFLTSLKEFIARRGSQRRFIQIIFPVHAAAKWIKRAWNEERLQDYLAKMEIMWQFNLSRAPWWGGQFERLVGLVKQTLFKVMGKSYLSTKELKSLLMDVETTLNNRPLGYIEDDIQQVILTPNVMMFGQPVIVPDIEDTEEDENLDLKKRYKHLKACKDRVWRRWSEEYLKQLRERHNMKHKSKELTLKDGDVVIIKGDEKNRKYWKLGIVTKLIKGRDGAVRAVRLRAGKSFLERAV